MIFNMLLKFYWPENFIQLVLLPDSRYVIWLALWFIRLVLLPGSNWNATRFIPQVKKKLAITRKVIRLFETITITRDEVQSLENCSHNFGPPAASYLFAFELKKYLNTNLKKTKCWCINKTTWETLMLLKHLSW